MGIRCDARGFSPVQRRCSVVSITSFCPEVRIEDPNAVYGPSEPDIRLGDIRPSGHQPPPKTRNAIGLVGKLAPSSNTSLTRGLIRGVLKSAHFLRGIMRKGVVAGITALVLAHGVYAAPKPRTACTYSTVGFDPVTGDLGTRCCRVFELREWALRVPK